MITSFFSPKSKRDRASSSSTGAPSAADDDGAGRTNEVTPSPPSDENPANKRQRKTGSPIASSPASLRRTAALSPEAEDLLSHFADDDGGEAETSWRRSLIRHISSPAFGTLAKFVASERAKGKTVYPPPEDTFSALALTPLSDVKVVVVGQDPYHGPGQGHGLAFSVRRGVAIPPSLRNMYKELLNDDGVPSFSAMPKHGYLERWARQGVLMLNSVLTVRRGEANSHKGKGWEKFTDEAIRAADRASGPKGLVFLLWGKPASKKAESVIGVGAGRHTVICTSHPSPLGAAKTKSPFLGSKCFSRANEALKKRGLEPIDWNVDGPLGVGGGGDAAKKDV